MTADPDKPPTLTLATMERVSKLGGADAVKMQLDAQQHRLAAVYMEERGDRIGPRFELAEAERLEHEAELVLDPVMHCTGRVTVGNGGEMAIGTKAMDPFVDTVRERPDMLAIDASQQRMELADKANVLTLGIDAAATIKAENSAGEDAGAPDGGRPCRGDDAAGRCARTAADVQAHRLHQPASQHRGRTDDERFSANDGKLPARPANDPEGPQRREADGCCAARECRRRRSGDGCWAGEGAGEKGREGPGEVEGQTGK